MPLIAPSQGQRVLHHRGGLARADVTAKRGARAHLLACRGTMRTAPETRGLNLTGSADPLVAASGGTTRVATAVAVPRRRRQRSGRRARKPAIGSELERWHPLGAVGGEKGPPSIAVLGSIGVLLGIKGGGNILPAQRPLRLTPTREV